MNQPSFDEKNIRLLGDIYPEIASGLSKFIQSRKSKESTPLYLFKAGEGVVLCRESSESGGRWVHGPDDPLAQAQDFISENDDAECGLIIVWQAGLGYAPRLLEQMDQNKRVIICESRYELIWEWLCRWDCDAILNHERFYWIIQDDFEHKLMQLAREYPSLFKQGFKIIPGSVLTGMEKDRLKDVSDRIQSSLTKTNSDDLHKVFMIMSQSLEDIMPSVMRGAGQNGFHPLWKKRPLALSRFLSGINVWRETCGCTPEIALGFYGSYFSHEELKSMGRAGTSRVVWYYDNPETLFKGDEGEYYDLALTFDTGHLDVMKPVFGSKAKVLAPATTFDDYEVQGDFKYPINPVTYVGATGYRLSLPYLKQNPQLFTKLAQVIRTVVQSHLGMDAKELLNLLIQSTLQFDPQQSAHFKWLVRQISSSEIRKVFLETAMPFGLTIFGDALWRDRNLVGGLTSAYAGTSLHYDSETPELYAASSINLSICHTQLIHAASLRAYDVLACGGFLLTEYRPAIEEQFEIGKDLDVFRTPQELAQKITFYLENEELRREIAAHGRATVLANHTYRNRIAQMIELLKDPR